MNDKKKTQLKNLLALFALALMLAAAGLVNRIARPAMDESTGTPVEGKSFFDTDSGE